MVEDSAILSLVILITLQVSQSLRSTSVKGKLVRLILPCGQRYISMPFIPRELVLCSILETTFIAMARARTREPFIYNNRGCLNRILGCFTDLMIYLTERIGTKEKFEWGREEVRV